MVQVENEDWEDRDIQLEEINAARWAVGRNALDSLAELDDESWDDEDDDGEEASEERGSWAEDGEITATEPGQTAGRSDDGEWLTGRSAGAEAAELSATPVVASPLSADSSSPGDSEDGWPELRPIDMTVPLASLPPTLLPQWAGDYAAALAVATETPVELATGLILATAAVACARRLRIQVAPGHIETTNLWISIALDSGNRKSAVQTQVCAPLQAWERARRTVAKQERQKIELQNKNNQTLARAARTQATKALGNPAAIAQALQSANSYEMLIAPLPVMPQLWTSDATPEKMGTLLADQGECMAWLSAEAGLFGMLGGRYAGAGGPNLDLF